MKKNIHTDNKAKINLSTPAKFLVNVNFYTHLRGKFCHRETEANSGCSTPRNSGDPSPYGFRTFKYASDLRRCIINFGVYLCIANNKVTNLYKKFTWETGSSTVVNYYYFSQWTINGHIIRPTTQPVFIAITW